MNLSAGYPLNLIRAGIPYDYARLQKNCRADVVIMGGGISGALVAYYLQKAGIECMVVDRRTFGLGSTCASTSLLQYEIDEPLSRLKDKIGLKNAERAYHLCEAAITEMTDLVKKIGYTDLQSCNSIYFAAGKKDTNFLQQEFAARKKSGFDVKWIEESDIKKIYGLNAPAAIVSATGAQTNAYTLTHALHQHAIASNIKLYDRTPIENITHTKSGVVLHTADGYTIRCKKLVYATGYEAVKYINRKIVNLSVTYATASEQFDKEDHFPEGNVFWNTADPYLYMRTTEDRRIIVGGRDEPYTSLKKMNGLVNQKSSLLQKDLMRKFPAVAFKKEFSWAGVFGATKDGLPFIGNYPELPNSLFALGFGGNGITFSVIAAQLIRNSLLGRPNPDAALFSFDRV